jgi:hypothetical protein
MRVTAHAMRVFRFYAAIAHDLRRMRTSIVWAPRERDPLRTAGPGVYSQRDEA